MNVVLFRHAKKGMTPFDDPSLSPEGFLQGEKLPVTVQKQNIPAATELWASEKIRTHQTFSNLSESLRLPILTKPELNLRSDSETRQMFQNRIQRVIEELSVSAYNNTEKHCIYLCTHYDWIEEAMLLIPSDKNLTGFEFAHWAPAQFIYFNIDAPQWIFIKKGQQS